MMIPKRTELIIPINCDTSDSFAFVLTGFGRVTDAFFKVSSKADISVSLYLFKLNGGVFFSPKYERAFGKRRALSRETLKNDSYLLEKNAFEHFENKFSIAKIIFKSADYFSSVV